MVKTPTAQLVVCCCIHAAHLDPPPISSRASVTQHPITDDASQDAQGGNMCLELTIHDHVFVLNYSLSLQVNGSWVIAALPSADAADPHPHTVVFTPLQAVLVIETSHGLLLRFGISTRPYCHNINLRHQSA